LEKYIPYIDWESFKERAKQYTTDIDTDVNLKTEEQNAAQAGGMMPQG
jgi:hypothetical protein